MRRVTERREPCEQQDRGERLDQVLVGGRRPTRVELVGYDDTWPQRFAAERARIVTALGPRAVAVHHVGSTSVPGLAAKDRVDVCLVRADPQDPATNVHVYTAGDDEVTTYAEAKGPVITEILDRARRR